MKIEKLPVDIVSSLRTDVTVTSTAQCIVELVLNSIDAGSTSIAVRVDLNLFKLQVIDNGCGLSHSDMNVIGTRYMTSKCQSMKDFQTNLSYFGFRGEALASLKEVSGTLTITSRPLGSDETYWKLFLQGKAQKVSVASHPRGTFGTTVIVGDFLHNRPVRKARIKPALEIEEIKAHLESIVLINPHISFTFRNEATNEMILEVPKVSDIVKRFGNLYKEDIAQNLVSVHDRDEPFKIEGFIATEAHCFKTLQFMYINKRLVLKTKLHKLVNSILSRSSFMKMKSGIYGAISKELNYNAFLAFSPPNRDKHAVYLLNITCPHSEYDISIDPKKTLVEFRNWDGILRCLERTVRKFVEEDAKVLSDKESVSSSQGNPISNVLDEVNELAREDALGVGLNPEKNQDISTRNISRALHGVSVNRNALKFSLDEDVVSSSLLSSSGSETISKIAGDSIFVSSPVTTENPFPTPYETTASITKPSANPAFCSLNTTKHNAPVNEPEGMFKVPQIQKKKSDNKKKPIFQEETWKENLRKVTGSKESHSVGTSQEDIVNTPVKRPPTPPLDMKNIRRKKILRNLQKFSFDVACKKPQLSQLSSKLDKQTGANVNTKVMAKNSVVLKESKDVQTDSPFLLNVQIQTGAQTKSNRESNASSVQHKKCREMSLENKCGETQNDFLSSLVHHTKYSPDSMKNVVNANPKINNIPECISLEKGSLAEEISPNPYRTEFEMTIAEDNDNSFHRSEVESTDMDKPAEQKSTPSNQLVDYDSTSSSSSVSSNKCVYSSSDEEEECNLKRSLSIGANGVDESKRFCLSLDTPNAEKLTFFDYLSPGSSGMEDQNSHYSKMSEDLLVRYDFSDAKSGSSTHCSETYTPDMNSSLNKFCLEDDDSTKILSYETNRAEKQMTEAKHPDFINGRESLNEEGNLESNSYSNAAEDSYLKTCNSIQSAESSESFSQFEVKNATSSLDLSKNSNEEFELSPIENLAEPNNSSEYLVSNCLLDTENLKLNDVHKEDDASFQNPISEPKESAESISCANDCTTVPSLEKEDTFFNNSKSLTEPSNSIDTSNTLLNSQSEYETQTPSNNFDDDIWIKNTDHTGQTFYMHKYSGMTMYNNPLQNGNEQTFTFKKRCTFLPKGTSPIFQEGDRKEGMKKSCASEANSDSSSKSWPFLDMLLSQSLSNSIPVESQIATAEITSHPRADIKVYNVVYPYVFNKDIFNNLRVVGQLDNKFIVTIVSYNESLSTRDLLVLFDQHAVHERIRVESLTREYEESDGSAIWKFTSIEPSVPLTLSAQEVRVLDNFREKVERLGLFYDIVDSTTIRIKCVPTCLLMRENREVKHGASVLRQHLESLIREQVQSLLDTNGTGTDHPTIIHNVINYEACRGAIKFGHPLNISECQAFLQNLSKCNLPFQCAHGRPALVPIVDMSHIQQKNLPGKPNLKRFRKI